MMKLVGLFVLVGAWFARRLPAQPLSGQGAEEAGPPSPDPDEARLQDRQRRPAGVGR